MTRYRVYFNREREWPQCWSVDEGDQISEINVTGFVILGCNVTSHTLDRSVVVDHDRTPYAWLEVCGRLFMTGGVARFSIE